MKIKTKYNIGDIVKYLGEDIVNETICKCCNSNLAEMKAVKMKGKIRNIDIKVEEDNISIDYEINNDFISEKSIIRKVNAK